MEQRPLAGRRGPEHVQRANGGSTVVEGNRAEGARRVPLATPFGRLVRDRGSARGVILSAVVHLGLAALVLWSGSRLLVADRMPGEGSGRGGGGGGGGGRALLLFQQPAPTAAVAALPVPPPPPLVMPRTPPIPLPEVKPAEIPPPNLTAEQLLSALNPGSGPGQGPGIGPGAGSGSGGGTGSGRGPGVGPDSGSGGGGGRIYPPQPQGIIMPPPDRPSSVRGMTVTVLFEISARGEVMRVSIDPMPRDRKFADAFLERLRRYTFTPAYTLDGHPIAAVYPIRITL